MEEAELKEFSKLVFKPSRIQSDSDCNTAIAVNEDSTIVYKLELFKHPRKLNDLRKEYEIINNLNDKNCSSAPKVFSFNTILGKYINTDGIDIDPEKEFAYYKQEYLPSDSNLELADVIFALLEQKSLGIYQGDVKPNNIRFSSRDNICKIFDYDQAIYLDETQISASNLDFFKFLDDYEIERYGQQSWLRHFKLDISDSKQLLEQTYFKDNSLNLAKTKIYKTQVTTNTQDGIYHTIKDKSFYLNGIRSFSDHHEILNKIPFKAGESILDVGCNSGALSLYMHDRGCKVTGVDVDKYIVHGAQMIANILKKQINYYSLDLDKALDIPKVDTVLLFSVLHHTRDIEANAAKIAQACSRVILEVRPIERGSQPLSKGRWERISGWELYTVAL